MPLNVTRQLHSIALGKYTVTHTTCICLNEMFWINNNKKINRRERSTIYNTEGRIPSALKHHSTAITDKRHNKQKDDWTAVFCDQCVPFTEIKPWLRAPKINSSCPLISHNIWNMHWRPWCDLDHTLGTGSCHGNTRRDTFGKATITGVSQRLISAANILETNRLLHLHPSPRARSRSWKYNVVFTWRNFCDDSQIMLVSYSLVFTQFYLIYIYLILFNDRKFSKHGAKSTQSKTNFVFISMVIYIVCI